MTKLGTNGRTNRRTDRQTRFCDPHMEACRHTKNFNSKLKIRELAVDCYMHPRMTGMHKYPQRTTMKSRNVFSLAVRWKNALCEGKCGFSLRSEKPHAEKKRVVWKSTKSAGHSKGWNPQKRPPPLYRPLLSCSAKLISEQVYTSHYFLG